MLPDAQLEKGFTGDGKCHCSGHEVHETIAGRLLLLFLIGDFRLSKISASIGDEDSKIASPGDSVQGKTDEVLEAGLEAEEEP